MSSEFDVGDVVELKSGSPKMTFGGTGHRGDAIVIWFKDGNIMQSQIPLTCLQRIPASGD